MPNKIKLSASTQVSPTKASGASRARAYIRNLPRDEAIELDELAEHCRITRGAVRKGAKELRALVSLANEDKTGILLCAVHPDTAHQLLNK